MVPDRNHLDLLSYKEELVTRLGQAWVLARGHVKKAQGSQKRHYDKRTHEVPLCEGDCLFLHVPSLRRGKIYKFSKPFKGLLKVYENGADIQMVDNPKMDPI